MIIFIISIASLHENDIKNKIYFENDEILLKEKAACFIFFSQGIGLCILYTYEISCIASECFTPTRGIVFESGKRERGKKNRPWGLKMVKTR